MPLVMLVTARSASPDRENTGLSDLIAHSSTEMVLLPELSAAGSALVVRESLATAADEFCAACHRASGGNPFLLRELLAALHADGVAPTREGAKRVRKAAPARVEQAVAQRLASLDERATRLARALAVLGDAELNTAAALAGLARDDAILAGDALTAANLIGNARPLRFSHPLLRGAAYATIAPRRRAELHFEAARVLGAAGAPAEDVVVHLLSCDPAGEGWVVEVLREAAWKASERGDLDTAVTLLRRALLEPPPPSSRPAILLQLGMLEGRVREPEAADHLRRALTTAGDPERRRRAALELHRVLAGAFRWQDAADVIDETAAQLRSERPDLARGLEIELVANTRLNPAMRPGALQRLHALGEPDPATSSEDRLLLAVLAHEAELSGRPAEDVISLARRALAGGALLAEQGPESPSPYYAAQALAASDQLDEAERTYAEALNESRRQGSVMGFVLASCFRCGSALRRGAILDAEAEARAAVEATGESGWGPGTPAATAFLVSALIERGLLNEAQEVIDSHGLGAERVPDTLVANHLLLNRGRLRIARGELRVGAEDLIAFGERALDWGAVNPATFPWRADAAQALAALGDKRRARALADEELQLASEFGAPRARGIALRAAGIARGGKTGVRLLVEACEVLENSPARLDHARGLLHLGVAMHALGDSTAAREPLRRCLDIAHRCGATATAERARDELRAAGGRPRRVAISGVDALTPSERRICLMAGNGMLNREIAESQFVTVATVEAHLRNSYRKLGIDSRDELPRVLRATPAGPRE
jgi:DNA-binding CsgD family transcriptional regulator